MSIPAPTSKKEIEEILEPTILNKIKIQISYSISNLSIYVEQINAFPKIEYLLTNSLSEFQKFNKYFKYFETTEELAKSINESIKDKSINVIINNNINCELEINNPILKTKFKLNIPIKENILKDELANIIPYIKELNLKFEKLEKENKELAKKVDLLMTKNEEKNYYSNQAQSNLFKESNIITSESTKLILSFLINKPVKTKLLYDSKIHGDTAKAFHSQCDGKNPSIYIVKTKNGFIFGGYLSVPWQSKNNYSKDDDAFFFSINLKKKYSFDNKNEVIYGNPGYGPVICGGIRMDICNNALTSENNFLELQKENQGSKYEINGGSRKFYVQNYEVHQLEY